MNKNGLEKVKTSYSPHILVTGEQNGISENQLAEPYFAEEMLNSFVKTKLKT